jgi:hypothetical protein
VGWKEAALESGILGKYNQFEEDYWDLLRQGFDLNDAVNESLPPAGGTRIWKSFAAYGVSSWQQPAGYPPVKTKVARIKKALIEALAQTGRQSAIPGFPGILSLSIYEAGVPSLAVLVQPYQARLRTFSQLFRSLLSPQQPSRAESCRKSLCGGPEFLLAPLCPDVLYRPAHRLL